MKDETFNKIAFGLWLVWVAISLTGAVAITYVAIHFISKLW